MNNLRKLFVILIVMMGVQCMAKSKSNEHAKIWYKEGKFKRSANAPCKDSWRGWYYTENPCQHCKDDVVRVTCGSGLGEYTQPCYGHCPHGKKV